MRKIKNVIKFYSENFILFLCLKEKAKEKFPFILRKSVVGPRGQAHIQFLSQDFSYSSLLFLKLDFCKMFYNVDWFLWGLPLHIAALKKKTLITSLLMGFSESPKTHLVHYNFLPLSPWLNLHCPCKTSSGHIA